jgi:hypothetical protein
VVLFSISISVQQYGKFDPSMEDNFRDPMIEDAVHTIVLQNRCGNRASILADSNRTDIQFVYKPNAFRRKDFHARNFSGRDIYTQLFAKFSLPRLKESYIKDFNYDPFLTQLDIKIPNGAENKVSVLNIADENVFAVAAKAPLLINVKLHKNFQISERLLLEVLSDRGERFVSFIHFNDIDRDRLRKLKDGSYR